MIAVYDRADNSGLRIDFEANPALYSVDELSCHGRRFLSLLEDIANEPAQPIGRLELLEPEEREQILVRWNDTGRPVPDATLPALFEAQVGRSPQATALVFEGDTLSYSELNARANRLAHFLIGQGIGPEILVAIALPRSIEMVVSLLAILKAGAAYLPLDPDYPPERLVFMLQDAQPAYVLTTGKINHRLPDSPPRLFLDEPGTAIALAGSLDTDPTQTERTQPLSSLNPAYIIYTSGSTGGCGHNPSEHRAPFRSHRTLVPLWPGGRLDSVSFRRVRLLSLGALGSAPPWRPSGSGSSSDEPFTGRVP
jgi:nonribosomal peptide synthetase DhbF